MNETIEVLMKYQTEVNRLNEVQLKQEKEISSLKAEVNSVTLALFRLTKLLETAMENHKKLVDALSEPVDKLSPSTRAPWIPFG